MSLYLLGTALLPDVYARIYNGSSDTLEIYFLALLSTRLLSKYKYYTFKKSFLISSDKRRYQKPFPSGPYPQAKQVGDRGISGRPRAHQAHRVREPVRRGHAQAGRHPRPRLRASAVHHDQLQQFSISPFSIYERLIFERGHRIF